MDLPRSGRKPDVELLTPPGVPELGATALVDTVPSEELEAEASLAADAGMWAIVLAGGIGSRFWPLSTPKRPKQLLSLVGDRPLIAETVARLAPTIPPERVLVITSRDIAAAIRTAIPEVPAENMLVEPRPSGTAAAVAWGATEVARRAGPETILCSVHADLAVGFPELFRHAVHRAARFAAVSPSLVTIGIRPTRSETGFGYMRPGAAIESIAVREGGASRVAAFIEKPGEILAETLIADGALWNAGIFVWRASVVLAALEKHTHELAPGLEALREGDYEHFAGMIQSVSIERGLLERSDRVLVVPGEFGWDDVGTWASLRRARELDDTGNGAFGPVHFVEATSNVVHAEKGTVVLYGCSSMLVVALDGLTFVTPIDRAVDLRPLLDALPPSMRTQPIPPAT